MTQIPLNFVIDNIKQDIHLFGLRQPLSSNTMATNISFVQWDGGTGIGKIIYNDRIQLPEQFTDPSPYQTYVNQWMTAASVAALPLLTLAQAQAVKSSLIDSVWSGKRQAPISVVTSLGTYSFDANDILSGSLSISAWMPAIANVIAQFALVNTQIAGINTAISNLLTSVDASGNTDFTNLASAITSAFSTLVGGINSNSSTTFATYITTDLNQLNAADTPPAGLTYSPIPAWSISAPTVSAGSLGGSYTPPSPPAALPALTAPVKMLPIGSTSYPAFMLADQFAVVAAVQTQRANEAAVRAVKQAAVAALTTIATVIAYDATAGW